MLIENLNIKIRLTVKFYLAVAQCLINYFYPQHTSISYIFFYLEAISAYMYVAFIARFLPNFCFQFGQKDVLACRLPAALWSRYCRLLEPRGTSVSTVVPWITRQLTFHWIQADQSNISVQNRNIDLLICILLSTWQQHGHKIASNRRPEQHLVAITLCKSSVHALEIYQLLRRGFQE